MIVKILILLLSTSCLVSSYYDTSSESSDSSDDNYDDISGSSEEKISTTPKVIHHISTTPKDSDYDTYDSSDEKVSTTKKTTNVDTDQINWQSGDDGQVQWAQYCNFDGNEIGNKKVRSEDCGSACLERSDCVTFSWTYDGGCYLKDGGSARYTYDTPICGKVMNRKSKTSNNDQSSKTDKDDADDDDIKRLSLCYSGYHSRAKVVTSSGLGGPIGALYDLALVSADRIIAGIDRFNECPAANECKFNITHHGTSGRNGLRSKWITMAGNVHSNDELLDGYGHQVDSGQEKIDGDLNQIYFTSYGEPCIKSITIACGNEVMNGFIRITHKHMITAWSPHSYRHIEADTEHNCVGFSSFRPDTSFTSLRIKASIFHCRQNDRACITSNFNID